MWKETIEKMRFDENKSWSEIAEYTLKEFPGLSREQAQQKARGFLRNRPRYNEKKSVDFEKSSLEYKKDGSIISEKLIEVRDGEEMTPEFILNAHGLDPTLWEIVSYKNNMWNTQVKGGEKQISYQSKLTAKPRTSGVDYAAIDKHFDKLDRKKFTPAKVNLKNGTLMAEVNIVDLHLGKLCWKGETPENFDYKIARDTFYHLIAEIALELKNKPLEYITFVWTHDFFNSGYMGAVRKAQTFIYDKERGLVNTINTPVGR